MLMESIVTKKKKNTSIYLLLKINIETIKALNEHASSVIIRFRSDIVKFGLWFTFVKFRQA